MESKLEDNITIIGAGYVGLCTGAVLLELGHHINFLDLNTSRINTILEGKSPVYEPGLDQIIREGVSEGRITATADYMNVSSSNVFIISVNTPIDEKYEVKLDYLISACNSLARVIKKDSLVILRSTVPPLTLREYVVPIFEKSGHKTDRDLFYAVIPERLAEGHALADMKENPIIIGASNEIAYNRVEKLWNKLNLQTIRVSWEEAELTKLTDNLWIDVNIAMANEIALVSEKVGADARKVIQAANTLKKGSGYVNILMPGIGVGGSCLPKDPHILSAFSRKVGVSLKLPGTSRAVNDQMPDHMYDLIMENLTYEDSKRIILLGLSFNANSGDMRYSPSIYLNRRLQESGFQVYGYDPLVNKSELSELSGVTILDSEEEFFETLSSVDTVAVVAAHASFKQKKKEMLEHMGGMLVVDGRYLFELGEVSSAGAKYVAVGVGYK